MNEINEANEAPPVVSRHGEDNYEHVSPGLIYIDASCPGPGIDSEMYYSLPKGCTCQRLCNLTSCSCMEKYVEPSCSVGLSHFSQPVFECNQECTCGSFCPNRVVQNGPWQCLKVMQVGEKGYGVFTEVAIPKGTFVCEYAGEIIGISEAEKRLNYLQPTDSNYILVLREHVSCKNNGKKLQITIIDPTTLGNIGRYLNHSCDPNLDVVPIRLNSLVPIAAMFTIRHVLSGEELSYNYDGLSPANPEEVQGNDEKFVSEGKFMVGSSSKSASNYYCKPCLCSSSNCKKYLPINSKLFD